MAYWTWEALPVEQEEEAEEEVVFDGRKDADIGDDEKRVVTDYESDPDMT